MGLIPSILASAVERSLRATEAALVIAELTLLMAATLIFSFE